MAIYNEEQDPNILGLNTTKKDLISEIKEIIDNYGAFSTGEVQASCSPSVPNQKGNLAHLIEYFSKEKVDVEVWSESIGESVDNYSLTYKELNIETLKEILELCQAWQEINTKE